MFGLMRGLFAVASLLYTRNKIFCSHPGRKIMECVGAAVSGSVLGIKALVFSSFLLLLEVCSAWVLNCSLKSIHSMLIYCRVSCRNDMYVQIKVKLLLFIAAAMAIRFIHIFHISSSCLICSSLPPELPLSSLKLSAVLNRKEVFGVIMQLNQAGSKSYTGKFSLVPSAKTMNSEGLFLP